MSTSSSHPSVRRLEAQAKRVHEIVGVLMKYRLGGWLREIPVPLLHTSPHEPGQALGRTTPECVRLALTELGTTFIKLGQVLATRPDLVGEELAEELTKLQTHTSPDPPAYIRARIAAELGKPPEELFAEFDDEPFGSASVAQVHRAVLRTGERVVVKVRREGVEQTVAEDLSIMASLAELAEKHSANLRSYHPVALVAEFRQTLTNELDFVRERRNLDRFNRNFADDESVRFPEPFGDLSGRGVLTMSLLDGVLGTDIAGLRESRADLKEFAKKGATVFLDMIFRDSFYHADPHPGNLMLLSGGVLGVIDCGMVGRLDENLHDDFESLMLAVSTGDAEGLTDTLWRLSPDRPAAGRAQLEADLSELLSDVTEVSFAEIDIAGVLNRLVALFHKYRISLRPGLASLLRTLVLLQGTAQRLDPSFSLGEVLDPYLSNMFAKRFSPEHVERRLVRGFRDWDRLLQTLPRDISGALAEIQAGDFKVQIRHRRLDSMVNRLTLGVVLAATILGSSLLWSMKAPPLAKGVSVPGASGCILAFVLAIILVRAVFDSGKVTSDE